MVASAVKRTLRHQGSSGWFRPEADLIRCISAFGHQQTLPLLIIRPLLQSLGYGLLGALLGGLLVAAATGFVVPVLESVLGKTTDIKLLELSDTNLPHLDPRLQFRRECLY